MEGKLKKLSYAIISAASLFGLDSEARAEFKNGNDLYAYCSAKENSATYYQDAAACSTYIVGVYDAIEMEKSLNKSNPYYCLPKGVIVRQLTEIVTNDLKAHPERRHLPAAALVAIALRGAFPCSASNDVEK